MRAIRHHHANSLLNDCCWSRWRWWSNASFACAFLHRGQSLPLSSQLFVTHLRLSLGAPRRHWLNLHAARLLVCFSW